MNLDQRWIALTDLGVIHRVPQNPLPLMRRYGSTLVSIKQDQLLD